MGGKDDLFGLMVNRSSALRGIAKLGYMGDMFLRCNEDREEEGPLVKEYVKNDGTGEMEEVLVNDEEEWAGKEDIGRVAFVEFFLHVSDVMRFNRIEETDLPKL